MTPAVSHRSSPAAPNRNRGAQLRELIEAMAALSAPPALTIAVSPDLPNGAAAQLAHESAQSAEAIAHAAALLGTDDQDEAHALTLWRETLAQISRIQRLYDLPPLPFQSQPSPGPGT